MNKTEGPLFVELSSLWERQIVIKYLSVLSVSKSWTKIQQGWRMGVLGEVRKGLARR